VIPYQGHVEVLAKLEAKLPRVLLLQGPESVGKRTMLLRLIETHGFKPADFLWREKLDVAAAHDVRAFAQRRALGPAGKLVGLRLDHASDAALNMLLKTLEEPPPKFSFALLATSRPLETIVSRAERYNLGLLSEAEMRDVLLKRLGMAPDLARRAARLGRGQVSRALATDTRSASRMMVMSTLKAVADGDPIAFEVATRSWDEEAHDLLLVWITEAVTGAWALFSADDFPKLSLEKSVPRRMLGAMRPGIKPKLAVRSALASFLDW
jgi:hypothetical protein